MHGDEDLRLVRPVIRQDRLLVEQENQHCLSMIMFKHQLILGDFKAKLECLRKIEVASSGRAGLTAAK
jgi:hypothetical protein